MLKVAELKIIKLYMLVKRKKKRAANVGADIEVVVTALPPGTVFGDASFSCSSTTIASHNAINNTTGAQSNI
jgi:hypothetical protein